MASASIAGSGAIPTLDRSAVCQSGVNKTLADIAIDKPAKINRNKNRIFFEESNITDKDSAQSHDSNVGSRVFLEDRRPMRLNEITALRFRLNHKMP